MPARRRKALWSILVVATLVCAVLGLAVARTIKLTPRPNQLARGPVQNIRFTLYDAGIFPQQQHVRPGNVSINLEDRTHQSAGLVVQREAGGVAGQVKPVPNQARGRAEFSLGVGLYFVFDASQPNNRAELVIE